MTQIKIEVWSDFVCPFCYIGKINFEKALANFPQKEDVVVEFKSYQLDPNTPPYTGQDFYESMAAKFGGVEQSKQMMAGVAEQAKAAGLDFYFDTMKQANTFDAHRLSNFAKKYEKDTIINEKLFYANFTQSKDIGNMDTLAEIAEDAGLDKNETLAVLQDKQAYAGEVNTDIKEAKQLGITSVPNFIINRKYALAGAQPPEAFAEALEKVWEEENSSPVFKDLSANNDTDAACGDDGCQVPSENE